MKNFRARFVGYKPKSSLGNIWLQSCEHFFGLVSVDSAVRGMDGHDIALRYIQQDRVALPTVRMPPPPPLLSIDDVIVPEQPWTLHRRKSHSKHPSMSAITSTDDRRDVDESSGSETETDTSALYKNERIAREYGHMTESRARVLLEEKNAEAAHLRALVERAEIVVHGMCQANNQWISLTHLRLSRMIEEHSEMNNSTK